MPAYGTHDHGDYAILHGVNFFKGNKVLLMIGIR